MHGRTNLLPDPAVRAFLDAGVNWYPASEEPAFRARRDARVLAWRRRERFRRDSALRRRRTA